MSPADVVRSRERGAHDDRVDGILRTLSSRDAGSARICRIASTARPSPSAHRINFINVSRRPRACSKPITKLAERSMVSQPKPCLTLPPPFDLSERGSSSVGRSRCFPVHRSRYPDRISRFHLNFGMSRRPRELDPGHIGNRTPSGSYVLLGKCVAIA